jgi:hypothetical protein
MFDVKKGLFDLTNLDEKADDDILLANTDDDAIYEDTNVSVPGGLSERPSGAPSDTSINTPAKKEITVDAYQAALANLKKSFKEAVDIFEDLENRVVVQESAEDVAMRKQEEYLDNLILEAYENGPIFEAVNKSDKDTIKKIVINVRKKIRDLIEDQHITFYPTNKFSRIIIAAISGAVNGMVNGAVTGGGAGALGGMVIGGASGAGGAALSGTFWSTRLWQIVGMVYVEDGNIQTLTKHLNEKLNEELGDYKLLPIKVLPDIADLFRTKFGWKNNKQSYMLLVDKKMPMEVKKAMKETNEAIKDAANEKMTESEIEEFSDDIYELTESYGDYIFMEKCSKEDLPAMKKELKDRQKQLKELSKDDSKKKQCKALQKSINKLEKKIEKAENC